MILIIPLFRKQILQSQKIEVFKRNKKYCLYNIYWFRWSWTWEFQVEDVDEFPKGTDEKGKVHNSSKQLKSTKLTFVFGEISAVLLRITFYWSKSTFNTLRVLRFALLFTWYIPPRADKKACANWRDAEKTDYKNEIFLLLLDWK